MEKTICSRRDSGGGWFSSRYTPLSPVLANHNEIADFKRPVKEDREIAEKIGETAWAAKATATPPMPNPVRSPEILTPKLSKRTRRAIPQATTLIPIRKTLRMLFWLGPLFQKIGFQAVTGGIQEEADDVIDQDDAARCP